MSDPKNAFARLHFECVGGAAGDMILAALIDLGADVAAIDRAFESMRQPGLRLDVEEIDVNGEAARYVRSIAPDPNGHHRHLSDVLSILDGADMPRGARHRAGEIFEILCEAEAAVHGGSAQDVHLHEVGELDSIMDVVGIAVALDTLGSPPASATPLPSGHGTVNTAHGVLDCPVPAVVQVAEGRDVPLVAVDVSGETVTPTGISVLAQVCQKFDARPFDDADATGVGAGTKRFADRPNVVRVHGYR